MKRAMSFYLVFVLCLAIVPASTVDGVGSPLTFDSQAALDGIIYCYDADYDKSEWGTGTLGRVTGGQAVWVGHTWNFALTNYWLYRTYISFDTSSIPDDEDVISAELSVTTLSYYQDNIDTDFNLDVYHTDYGASLDATLADWNATENYEGQLLNTTQVSDFGAGNYNQTFKLDVHPYRVNTTGRTQYKLKGDFEGSAPPSPAAQNVIYWLMFHSGDSVYPPILSVQTVDSYGMTVTYNYTQAGMTNRTTVLYPEEQFYNNTHSLFKYWIYSTNETWLNVSVDSRMAYTSIHPWATVTDYGGGVLNVTNTWDNTYYQMFFIGPKNVDFTEVHIALYHSTLGEGFFWEKWRVMICEGQSFDYYNASTVTNPSYLVERFNNYTIGVLDYFGNLITTYSFIANAQDMDILIPLNVYQFNMKSFRTDTTAYAIYFNATGTPYQDHIPSEEYDELALREGTYMFQFTYLTSASNGTVWTVGNSYFYNLTINATYTVNIGVNQIVVLVTSNNGQTTTLDTMLTWTTPSVLEIGELLPVVPVGGTRSVNKPTSNNTVMWLHPYAIIEADIFNSNSGTSGNFYDPSPDDGTTEIVSDTLSITGDYDTNILLNYTNGTNFANFSTNPALVDLMDYTDSKNFTFWANGTITAVRETTIRNWAVFYWQYETTQRRYTATLTLNNTGDYDWRKVYWMVQYVPEEEGGKEPDQASTTVYDQNNSAYLTFGRHFTTSQSGIHMTFDRFNASTWRAFTFRYWAAENQTFNPTELITIRPPYQTKTYGPDNADHYMGSGAWNNIFTETFQGDIMINLVDVGGPIDPDNCFVEDISAKRSLGRHEYTVSGNSIIINYKAIGSVPPGSTKTYEVYFLMTELEPQNWVFEPLAKFHGLVINALSFLFIFGAVLTGIGGVLTWRGGKGKDKGGFLLLLGIGLIIIFAIITMLNQMGIIV